MNYLWLDLETSGLDPEHRNILEVAAVLDVDGKAELIEVADSVITYPEEMFGPHYGWDPEAWEMHQKSGLLADMRGPSLVLGLVERMLCEALDPYPMNTVMLAGNSIHFDRSFIREDMPRLDGLLHYRHMDVSCLTTFLEGAGLLERDKGPKPHRAMPDVQRSIDTFYNYKDNVQQAFGVAAAEEWKPDWKVKP